MLKKLLLSFVVVTCTLMPLSFSRAADDYASSLNQLTMAVARLEKMVQLLESRINSIKIANQKNTTTQILKINSILVSLDDRPVTLTNKMVYNVDGSYYSYISTGTSKMKKVLNLEELELLQKNGYKVYPQKVNWSDNVHLKNAEILTSINNSTTLNPVQLGALEANNLVEAANELLK